MDVPRGHPDAILRPSRAQGAFDVDRRPPGPELAPYVDYHWYVGWSGVEHHEQQVVPQPRIHVAAEHGRLLVHGISREPFTRTLTGTGHTLGSSFLPGGFRCLLGLVGGRAGRPGGARGRAARPRRPAGGGGDRGGHRRSDAMVAAMESYLVSLDPRPDPVAEQVAGLVALAEREHGLTRAEDLAAHAGVSLRTLQRTFTDYVGIGPKWVVQRYRILDAAAAAHCGDPVDWAGAGGEPRLRRPGAPDPGVHPGRRHPAGDLPARGVRPQNGRTSSAVPLPATRVSTIVPSCSPASPSRLRRSSGTTSTPRFLIVSRPIAALAERGLELLLLVGQLREHLVGRARTAS